MVTDAITAFPVADERGDAAHAFNVLRIFEYGRDGDARSAPRPITGR